MLLQRLHFSRWRAIGMCRISTWFCIGGYQHAIRISPRLALVAVCTAARAYADTDADADADADADTDTHGLGLRV